MDKQTIIDVTKCIHFDKSDIPNGCTCYWDGECNHYCYYKQLKLQEQTLKEIKEIVKCSISLDCEHCPMADYCEELCNRDNNIQDIILQKINEVIKYES